VGNEEPGDRAVAADREFGLKVVKVLILVDWEEGRKEAVAQEVPEVEAVFTISELR